MRRSAVLLLLSIVLVAQLVAAPAAGQSAEYSGEIQLTGSQAADGSEFNYELGDNPDISEFNVSLTGRDNSIDETQPLTSGDNTISVGGNSPPTNEQISYESTTAKGTWGMEVRDVSDTTDFSFLSLRNVDAYSSGTEIKDFGSIGGSLKVYDPGTTANTLTLPEETDELQFTYYIDSSDDPVNGYIDIYYKPGDHTYGDFTADDKVGEIHWDEFDTQEESAVQSQTVASPELSSVSFDATIDGTTTSFSGTSGTKSVDLSRSTSNVDISAGAPQSVDLSYTETSKTKDPTVSINGNDVGVSGTLSDGETRNLTVSESWIESGQNNVSISTNNPANGPGSVVGFDYSHLTTGPSESISINATEWEEIINASKTYPDAQQNVDATITFADNVISVADIEISRNGGAWQTPSSWSMTNQTLVVDVGDVNSGDEIAVRAEGRRIDVVNGAIKILEPTTQGDSLDTKIRIDAPSSDFGIDTSGTSNQIHYGASESWDSSEYVEIDSAGDQIIRMPNVADGSTARIRRAPLSMSSSGDPVAVRIDDPDTPAWTVTDQGATPDSIDIDYLDPDPLTQYEIYSLNEERSLRTAEEDGGIASFTADGRAGSYEIRESVSTSSAAVAVAGGDDGSSSPLSIVALLVGLSGSLVGALVLGRRLGVGSTRTRIGIGLLLGTVGIELATARSVLGDLILGLQISADSLASSVIGGFLDSGAGIVVIGILILIALVIIRRRVGLPDWLLVSGGLLVGIFVIDEISGGLLTGALDELGPLVWILLLIGGGVLLYRVLAPRPINIGGNS